MQYIPTTTPFSIKAGRDQDAWKRQGTRNVVVRNCTLQSGIANGFCIGSEMSGGVENVWVDNCIMPNVTLGITLKANLDRGGFVRHVWVRNVTIDSCRQAAIRMQMDYHSYRGGNFPTDFDRITLENIRVRAARDYGWWAYWANRLGRSSCGTWWWDVAEKAIRPN